MTIGLWIVLGLLALLLTVVIWMLWPGGGLGLVWTTAPGGALKFRLKLGSLVPKLLGSDGVTLFGVVHIAGHTVSAYLLAHEVYHARSGQGHWFGFLWTYLTNGAKRKAEEEAAHEFGLVYRADPWIIRRSQGVIGG